MRKAKLALMLSLMMGCTVVLPNATYAATKEVKETKEVSNLNKAKEDNKEKSSRGWILENGNWYYIKEDGEKATGWLFINGKWFYLDENGVMAANTEIDGYKIEADGVAYNKGSKNTTNFNREKSSSWIEKDGKWYFIDSKGNKITNSWILDNDNWYYLKADGEMATGWLCDNGEWYYLDEDGVMVSNTEIDDHKIGADGRVVGEKGKEIKDKKHKSSRGWILENDNWYYIKEDGEKATGWLCDNGEWYYLDEDGVMASNTEIDGHKIGADGRLVGESGEAIEDEYI